MEYEKLNDTTLQVTYTPQEPAPIVKTYNLDFLRKQELAILKQRNDYILSRDAELAEVRELITQAETLGIKTQEEVDTEEERAKEAELQ